MCALLVRYVPNNPKSGTSQNMKLLPAKPKRQNLEHSNLQSNVPLILTSPCHNPRVKVLLAVTDCIQNWSKNQFWPFASAVLQIPRSEQVPTVFSS